MLITENGYEPQHVKFNTVSLEGVSEEAAGALGKVCA